MISRLMKMFSGGADSPLSRREKAKPDETDKKIATGVIPQKLREDVERLQEYYKAEFMAGLSINWTLQQALEILPRERKRVDSYAYTGTSEAKGASTIKGIQIESSREELRLKINI